MTKEELLDERDERLRANLGILFPSDGSVPGANDKGRYAVLSHTEGKNHNLTRAASLDGAHLVAKECIKTGEWIEGVFDLWELDGDIPPLDYGDKVRHDGEVYYVLSYDGDDISLVEEEDWDEYEEMKADVIAHPNHVSLIERGEGNDERDPKFYPVAGVEIVVHFTIPRR